MKDSHDNDTLMLTVYGNYLMNGGTHEGFMELNEDDVQIMYIVHESERVKNLNALLKSIAGMLGAKEV